MTSPRQGAAMIRRTLPQRRKIAPIVRMRLFTLNFDDAETDLDEDTARELFESLATPVLRDAEARLRKVMEG